MRPQGKWQILVYRWVKVARTCQKRRQTLFLLMTISVPYYLRLRKVSGFDCLSSNRILIVRPIRKINLSQYPKFSLVSTEHSCGRTYANHAEYDVWVE